MKNSPKLVITGYGLIGPFGVGGETLLQALRDKCSCTSECTLFDTHHQVAEVRDFRLADYVRNPRAERSPRISQFALAAAAQTLSQSGIDSKRIANESTAIVYGTGMGPAVATERSLDTIVTQGLNAVEPLNFQESVFNAPASLISIQFKIKGPIIVLPMGWTAGLYALKQGYDLLRRKTIERVLVVTADELAGKTLDALDRLGFISPNDGGDEQARPFDGRVNGTVLGEGAAAVLLESEDAARNRGGTPRVRISSCAVGGDALGPGVPDASGNAMAKVIRRAISQTGRSIADIDHVLAGTITTRESDLAELNGIEMLFGKRDYPCPVTSLKPYIGETMGPAGLISLIAGILEIEQGTVFGNRELKRADGAGITFPIESEKQSVRTVLINAIGVSGTYASVVLEAVT
uniref:3-oxoacyl-[acyl-carrier-protein] synthase II n=1 Tax=Candidatus Kentrum sp. FM TaxID=2126340 RepID=A0A450S567_9GAMM|nr:MAG: 3-oxoacyl-[acyl-carrier-protein] synthase II [Candidatus Kentron sp. FM]VFJ47330.1 MAG: 3-oxoacyl-[acyl-carrier-protein] synthase II [Candidatus Kentron sp. FM]VFK07556.1 MAG: 3-oxoacyl-[acyl-carrier-protein] synthase II [Candidatus Kentron sp. FM]